MSGPLLFARFAYPPNALGYCGPDAGEELLEYADAAVVDGGLRERERGFAGAWPYLELIAHANGLADPLDGHVVEAYWLGNELLDRVDRSRLGASFEERFRPVVGREWPRLAAVIEHAPRPHHNLHVFCVYPWTGLLRTGATEHALHVLDRCRVRWGRVREVAADGTTATVASRPLTWDGRRLDLGEVRPETVVIADVGRALAGPVARGDLVACHWDWACHVLTRRQARRLHLETASTLDLVNRRLPVSPPAAVLA